MRHLTIAAALCYLIGCVMMGIALFVAAIELPEPYGRVIVIGLIGYLIARLGDWVDDV